MYFLGQSNIPTTLGPYVQYNCVVDCHHPLPLPDPSLTTDNVMEELGEVEGKWRKVGYWLFIPKSKLDDFAATRQSDSDCLRALMEYWIDTHPCPSWRRLAIALKGMHMFTLADRVRDKYGGGEAYCFNLAQWCVHV